MRLHRRYDRRLGYRASIWVTFCVFGAAPAAWGHKLNLFTYVEGTTVHVEGYFADGGKAKNSDVTVLDASQKVIASGKTDENGEYGFEVAAPADVQIMINAGLGHQAEYLLAASDFAETAASASGGNDSPHMTANPILAAPDTAPAATPADTPLADAAPIQAIVQRAVAEGIKPLAREIDALKNKTTLQDIVSGFGYILGAFGIWAYLQARKQKQSGS